MTDGQAISEQTDLMQYVPKVHFEQIPIRNLVSNQEYQRNLSQNHVQRAAANFDLYQINPVKVSRRNGINYVFNGQHTIEIVALVSGSRETPVWCMVYDDLVYEHEADIFANQMKYVKPLLPYEIFMANIEAGNDKQLIIRDLVESYDLSITSSSVPGGICAVATLEIRLSHARSCDPSDCRNMGRCCPVLQCKHDEWTSTFSKCLWRCGQR